MKTELKQKYGWRNSLIFSRKGSSAEAKAVVSTKAVDAEARALQGLLAGLSAFERSWYFRAPLSSQFAEEIKQNKPRRKQKELSPISVAKKVRSRLPSLPIRRSTLIDIIKSKRGPESLLEEAALSA
jgi:hypothetical protein